MHKYQLCQDFQQSSCWWFFIQGTFRIYLFSPCLTTNQVGIIDEELIKLLGFEL
jgi:hypothetical protein